MNENHYFPMSRCLSPWRQLFDQIRVENVWNDSFSESEIKIDVQGEIGKCQGSCRSVFPFISTKFWSPLNFNLLVVDGFTSSIFFIFKKKNLETLVRGIHPAFF